MASREVITLQLGSFANFVGAHYWNIGDEVMGLGAFEDTAGLSTQIGSHTIFRATENAKGQLSFNPRAILFDMGGAMGALGATGSIAPTAEAMETVPAVATWDGSISTFRSEVVAPSSFLSCLTKEEEEEEDCNSDGEEDGDGDWGKGAGKSTARHPFYQEDTHQMDTEEPPGPLEAAAAELDTTDGVRYWSDYLKAVLHPRSVHTIRGVWAGMDEWGGYGEGASALGTEELREEAMDRVRFFAEECDRLQGFQVLAEDLGGWGRVTSDLMEELHQDYGSMPTVLFSVRAPAEKDYSESLGRRGHCWSGLNPVLSMAALSESVGVYTPLACPVPPSPTADPLQLLQWDPTRSFHSSAVCAAAFDCVTLPFRLQRGQQGGLPPGATDMTDLVQRVSLGRGAGMMTVASLFGLLPGPEVQDRHAIDKASDRRMEAAGHQQSQGRLSLLGRELDFSGLGGLHRSGSRELVAESVVFRGGRSSSGAPVGPSAALDSLDGWLAAEEAQRRALRHRCVAQQPLPVPLPFPGIFGPSVSRWGDVRGPKRCGGVASSPVLTRLQNRGGATRDQLSLTLEAFTSARKSAAGVATLSAWGYATEDLLEVEERFRGVISAVPSMFEGSSDDDLYQDEDSD